MSRYHTRLSLASLYKFDVLFDFKLIYMQKITPFLWFDANAEEAITFYTSVFKEAKVGNVVRYGDAGPRSV